MTPIFSAYTPKLVSSYIPVWMWSILLFLELPTALSLACGLCLYCIQQVNLHLPTGITPPELYRGGGMLRAFPSAVSFMISYQQVDITTTNGRGGGRGRVKGKGRSRVRTPPSFLLRAFNVSSLTCPSSAFLHR